jgi:hypothetical protein
MKVTELFEGSRDGIEYRVIHNMMGKAKRFKWIDGDWESPMEAKAWMKSHDLEANKKEPSMSPAMVAAREKYGSNVSDELLKQWVKQDKDDAAHERMVAREKKNNHPSLEEIWQEAETAIGNAFPDGDPIDALGPWMRKHGVTMDELNLATKKNGMGRGKGKKDYGFYDYLADMHEDFAQSSLHDAKQGHYGETYDDQWFARPNPWKSS